MLSELGQYCATALQLHSCQSWIAQSSCTDVMELDCQGTAGDQIHGQVCVLPKLLSIHGTLETVPILVWTSINGK